jgi:hypothetical protein
MIGIIKLATISFLHWLRLTGRRKLHIITRNRLGKSYEIDQGGIYKVFRDSVADFKIKEPTVLVVGFRLKVISSNPVMHWLFQRVCILTTPFWSGFTGFRVKLWMVNPETKDYLGIYQWDGGKNTKVYVTALEKVLKPLSTPKSVWYEIVPKQNLEPYLAKRVSPKINLELNEETE